MRKLPHRQKADKTHNNKTFNSSLKITRIFTKKSFRKLRLLIISCVVVVIKLNLAHYFYKKFLQNRTSSSWTPKYNYTFDAEVVERRLMPNAGFVFHNKLPKCGSTTMNDILRQLSIRNKFKFRKIEATEMAFDDEPALSEFLNLNLEEGSPFFLMQHHYWTNLTKYGFEQPTYSAFSVVCPLCKFGKY